MKYQIRYMLLLMAAMAVIVGCTDNGLDRKEPGDDMIICTMEYDPVCGDDGNTYGNRCMAEAAGIMIVSEGECPEKDELVTVCTLEYAPVCGEDGVTYGNRCMADGAGVLIVSEGECSGQDNMQFCTADYRPVCGVDGNTYSNRCMAEAAGVLVDREGECTSDDNVQFCTMEYLPVCGDDGVTYGNRCMAEVAGSNIVSDGECAGGEDDIVFCTMEYDPVCGSDGITYSNMCMAEAAGVSIIRIGECGYTQMANPASQNCINLGGNLELKTTTDGGTIGICSLFGVECEEWMLFRGECPTDMIPCTREYMPVCGADGKTYANRCNLVNGGTYLLHEGECP